LDLPTRLRIVCETWEGVAWLHSGRENSQAAIVHSDLKPANILVNCVDCTIKIADFGFAAPTKGRDGSGQLQTRVGTVDYMAPELHLGLPYDGKSDDLFAAGIILFMMLTKR
jgi:protein-serine/threonine kinase